MEQTHQEATNEETPPERLRELAQMDLTLASLVAKNPNASPELLTELAKRKDDLIRKNVAANPNTPIEILWWLGEAFPAEVLDNPVLPLLFLENLNLIEEIPQRTAIAFLKCPAVPLSLIEWAVKSPWYEQVHLSLATSSRTPRTVLEELAGSKKDFVADMVKLHVNYAGELEEDWREEFRRQINQRTVFSGQRLYAWKNAAEGYFFRILAAIDSVSEFFLELLARHEEADIRCLVASTRLPLNLLFELGQDREPKVRATVGKNPIAPTELLELLAKDKDANVRSGVAENSNALPKLLEELATDERREVREKVASNLNVSQKILEQLATDERREVREKVAKNPNTPAYLLEELAGDPKLFKTVASNPNVPKNVFNFKDLGRSKSERFKKLSMMLANSANTPIYILEKLEREGLADNPNAPKDLLEKCVGSNSVSVRVALASHPKVPENVIHLLAEDRQSRVRKTVAVNPRTPPAVLLQLWRDYEPLVRRAVATNPKAPFSILEEGLLKLLEYEQAEVKTLLRYLREKPEGLPTLLELIFEKSFSLTRTIALWHPQMPVKVLEKNGQSLVWLERCAIAQNPNTPTETLQLLATDGNRIVRAAAKENLKSR